MLSPMASRRREVPPGRSLSSTTGDVSSQPARLASGSFLWPSRFFGYDTITYPNENDPWSKYQLEFDNPEDEISFFLSTGLEHARYEGRIRPVLDVCADATLDDLLYGETPGPLRKTAWLIDGHWSEETWVSRPCLGALSARQLTIELLKKRYSDPDSPDDTNVTLINAERRLIFINDFDRWSLLALVKTCPRPHARQLGDFFHKHLCARPSIGVCFPSDGPPMFTLEFNLPFRAWRKSDKLVIDSRTKSSDQKPLRLSRDLSFLMTRECQHSNSTVHGLYTGHMACMITGFNQHRWTAYFAIDTWFENSEDAPDKVERYQYDLEDGMEFDPLSCGRNDASTPIWHPRAYFLEVMQNRLEQLNDEWEVVLQHMDTGVSILVSFQWFLELPEGLFPFQNQNSHRFLHKAQQQKEIVSFCRLPVDPSDLSAELFQKYAAEIDKFDFCSGELKEVLQELCQILQHTRRIGDSFLATDVNFFLNYDGYPGDASECYPYLTEIRRKFQEISQMCILFENLEARCDYIIENCVSARRKCLLRLDDANHRNTESQIRVDLASLTTEIRRMQTTALHNAPLDQNEIIEVRLLALSTLISLPFTHTTALFSADGVIAFRKDWKNFLVSLIIAYVLTVMVTTGLRYWIRHSPGAFRARMASTCPAPSQSFEEGRNVEISQVVGLRQPSAVSDAARSGAQVNDGMDEGRPWYFRRRMPIRPLQGLPVSNSDVELGSRLPPIP